MQENRTDFAAVAVLHSHHATFISFLSSGSFPDIRNPSIEVTGTIYKVYKTSVQTTGKEKERSCWNVMQITDLQWCQ